MLVVLGKPAFLVSSVSRLPLRSLQASIHSGLFHPYYRPVAIRQGIFRAKLIKTMEAEICQQGAVPDGSSPKAWATASSIRSTVIAKPNTSRIE